MKNNKVNHKHLPMIDNFEFMQWCDRLNHGDTFNPVKKRQAFILIHQEGLTAIQAGKRMRISKVNASIQSRDYTKLADEYLAEMGLAAAPKHNQTNNKLKADWRKLTKKKIESLPKCGADALRLGLMYFNPAKKCGDHMALKSSTSYRCVICRDNKRIKTRQDKTEAPKKQAKLVSVFGIERAVYS